MRERPPRWRRYRRVLATLSVVSMLVLAGCGAFVGGPSPTATPDASSATESGAPTQTATATSTPNSRVTVYGDAPVNATLVWERVESLFGETYDPPAVSVLDRTRGTQASPFVAALGLDEGIETAYEGHVGWRYMPRYDRVQLVPRNASRTDVERVLAHEYVHAVQYRTDVWDRAMNAGASRAALEGGAVYVEDVYTREFHGYSAIDRRCERYRNGTPYERYTSQPYCFGGQYFAEELDSPSDLFDPDLRLPNTTEQVLHPETTEGPTNLTVVDETPTDWHTPATMDRRGELFVRTVLGVELSEERASEAATGWGNDRLLTVTGDTDGYVWVLRWDTDDDADEFETAFADYLDARGNETVDGWRVDDDRYRLTTVDDRTVTVVTGNETFVDAVSVAGGGGNVTVSTDRRS